MSNTKANKVTAGFKCHGELKFQLAKEALGLGLTFSEYLEMIVSQRNNIHLDASTEALQKLSKKVAFYENSALKNYFRKFKGRPYTVLDEKGNKQTRQINSLEETYEIILSLAQNTTI